MLAWLSDRMIPVKTGRDLETMRAACRVARKVLDEVCDWIQPGQTTREIDDCAAERIRHHGGRSAFLGYRIGKLKYPCHACISVNDEVVHGMAGTRRVKFGDIISLDVGVVYGGFIGDNARTVAVGGCSVEAQRLMDITEAALYEGITQARVGRRVTDISRAVQSYVEAQGCNVVREFVGHGVGRSMHEAPQIPNYVDPKCNEKLRPGMTVAIEPMVNQGTAAVKVLNDGWTVVTKDGQLSAHFEHTVLITETEPEILTWPERMPLESRV